MICSLKREVQDLDPEAMVESAAVASEASAAVEVEATASSQREENLTKYKR